MNALWPPLHLLNKALEYLLSGELQTALYLEQTLGVNQNELSAIFHAFEQSGLVINKIGQSSYQLSKTFALLDKTQILAQQKPDAAPIWVESFLDSTNEQLLQKIAQGEGMTPGSVLVAETQTQGRGRQGNCWVSPFGANLYFSLYFPFEKPTQSLMGLSLAVGVAVAKTLEQKFHAPISLKWPNDIYYKGRKLGGILVELSKVTPTSCATVIGVGLNIQMPKQQCDLINQPVTDLRALTGGVVDRNELMVELQQELVSCLNAFHQRGFSEFVADFTARDVFAGQTVELRSATQLVQGICRGVNEQGCLVLEQDGQSHTFYSGELSVRSAKNASFD